MRMFICTDLCTKILRGPKRVHFYQFVGTRVLFKEKIILGGSCVLCGLKRVHFCRLVGTRVLFKEQRILGSNCDMFMKRGELRQLFSGIIYIKIKYCKLLRDYKICYLFYLVIVGFVASCC